MSYFQVNALERDALQVVRLIGSLKNSSAPINRIPPEVFSLIPNYWKDSDKDKALIKSTHVCRDWRKIFVLRPSLWTRLVCTNVSKTQVYISRSGFYPLEICLRQVDDTFYQKKAFLLAVPRIRHLKTLSVSGNPTQVLPVLVKHFSCALPRLEKLKIRFTCDQTPTFPDELFNGDLSSLRELSLAGVITSLPWRGLSNLTTFDLCDVPEDRILLTQLLDFFESAPHIHRIRLLNAIPDSSDAPAGRVVSLPHLKELVIIAQPAHSITSPSQPEHCCV